MTVPSRIDRHSQISYALTHKANSFKVFVHRNGLNFAPYAFNAIGGALTASGVGVMSYSRKLQSTTFGAPFVFKEYQGAIVHGALLPRVRLRLQYLVEQWKHGIRFSHISGSSEQEKTAIFLDELARFIIVPKQEVLHDVIFLPV